MLSNRISEFNGAFAVKRRGDRQGKRQGFGGFNTQRQTGDRSHLLIGRPQSDGRNLPTQGRLHVTRLRPAADQQMYGVDHSIRESVGASAAQGDFGADIGVEPCIVEGVKGQARSRAVEVRKELRQTACSQAPKDTRTGLLVPTGCCFGVATQPRQIPQTHRRVTSVHSAVKSHAQLNGSGGKLWALKLLFGLLGAQDFFALHNLGRWAGGTEFRELTFKVADEGTFAPRRWRVSGARPPKTKAHRLVVQERRMRCIRGHRRRRHGSERQAFGVKSGGESAVAARKQRGAFDHGDLVTQGTFLSQGADLCAAPAHEPDASTQGIDHNGFGPLHKIVTFEHCDRGADGGEQAQQQQHHQAVVCRSARLRGTSRRRSFSTRVVRCSPSRLAAA